MTIQGKKIIKQYYNMGPDQKPELLTLEQIKTKYPPQRGTFVVNWHGIKEVVSYTAEVSRNEDGLPLYFVPGSCVWVNPPEKKSSKESEV